MSKARNKIVGFLTIVVLVAVVIIISNGVYVVGENEYGVEMQFGKIVDVKSAPGLYFKTPFIKTAKTITKAIQLYDINPSDVITGDKKSMIADVYILWKVVDPVKFYQTLNASRLNAQDRTGVSVYNATKSVISSMTQDEIIAVRGEKLTSLITEDANADMTGYGIEIVQAQIKALDLPDDNKEAVYERMISERNNIAASYKAEGEAQAQKIRNDTDKQVTVLKANAEREAAKTRAAGEASYMKIMKAAYNDKNKADFYNFTRSLDALKNSLKGGNKTIMLDKESELAKLIYGVGME